MAEVLLYGEIYSYSAQEFITALEDAKNDNLTVRINTSGGSPEYAWGMIAKFSEHKGKKLVKVDGKAHSAGAYYLCYADDSEALDVSQMCIHRAAYPEWMEKNPEYVTQSMWDTLNTVNGHLRKALEAKIDVAKFEKLKGVKIDDIFSNDSRIDVYLTADEAKKVGLINRVVKITPAIKAEIDRYAIAANVKEPIQQENNSDMDINKIKAEHPALYTEVIALGEKSGAEKERKRVSAWNAWAHIDAEAVAKGIESGEMIDMNAISEFQAKATSVKALETIKNDSAGNPKTTEVPTAENADQKKEKAIADFEAKVKDHFKITA